MDPFDDVRKFWRALDKMFEELFEGPSFVPTIKRFEVGFREPFVDLNETKDELIITAELPGMNKKDIDVEVTEKGVEIRAQKKEERKRRTKGGEEFSSSSIGFYKALSLPVEVDPKTAKASYNNGILEIKVKKIKKQKGTKLKIE